MGIFFAYSIGMFLGIQIGKTINPTYQYLLNKYNKINTDIIEIIKWTID